MSDRRLTPANERVAAQELRGRIEAPRYSEGVSRMVSVPVADLLRAPGGARDRQLLLGATVRCFEDRNGWSFVQATADGYVGYLPSAALGDVHAPSHRVAVRATHAYSLPDFKSPERVSLSFASLLHLLPESGAPEDKAAPRFVQTALGFVPRAHLAPLDAPATDPVAEAEKLLGTPYLWGGNSAFGVDCSGLVQGALAACGRPCPGDSDLQEAALGRSVPIGSAARRGDLLFWKGHVAWVAGPDMLLHANVHAMAVAYEPLRAAVARIERQGDGPVTRHARLID